MKTWKQVEMRVGWMRLPYRVQDETLVSPDGQVLARTVQGASDRLMSPGHPDSKRQARRKQRDLARHGSREFKLSEAVYTPLLLREEQRIFTGFVASRLMGRR